MFLILLNAELCFSFQSNLLFFDSGFFFSNGRSGSESFARFDMNFVRWCTLTRNDRICFNVFGLCSFIMASVFVISGVIALGVFVNPSHSILFLANSLLWRLIARPSSSTFYINLSNSGS